MPFSSIHFIFIFLPLVLILFYLLPYQGWRNSILILASLLFFGWADPTHLPALLLFMIINYFLGRSILMLNNLNNPNIGRVFIWIAVLLNIAFLFFYKYLGFFYETLDSITGLSLSIKEQVLPLGISYLTFSSLSYLLDIYNGVQKPEKNILRFCAYLIMFPKLIQGPITRYKDIENDLGKSGLNLDNLLEGSLRFISGLAKKVILADSLAIVASRVFDGDFSRIGAAVAWYGLIAYTLQIYFDFSGYTDMAIGIGHIFGFRLPENFNFPYISKNISDFWRRWHMSLTAWFRTYIFIPLEFSRKHSKFFRQQTNILIVFLLTGLWHGASWNFVIWGLYFGLILAIELGPFGKWIKRIPAILQHVYSLVLIMIGWVFFRITSIPEWGQFFQALTGINGWTGIANLRSLNILRFWPLIVISGILSTPLLYKLTQRFENKSPVLRLLTSALYLLIFVLVISYILTNGFTPFIYEQF